jgi:hypothetical protein
MSGLRVERAHEGAHMRLRQYLDRLMRTHDASEGIAAFLERRAPHWRNA